ncbi:MAG: heme-binding protein [Gammaproteobacteria bacterium]|nr:heme-binding protein [Gammaproteobacteria bacterium]
MKTLVLSLVLALAASRAADAADITAQPTLTLEGAKRAVAAALAYARAHDAPGAAVAVVDAGGHTICLERLDGTFPASADVSIGKARTAANFGRATRGMEDSINKNRPALAAVAAVTPFTPLQGGIPIMRGKEVVGAIGVSGAASAEQDEAIAVAGAEALRATASSSSPVR